MTSLELHWTMFSISAMVSATFVRRIGGRTYSFGKQMFQRLIVICLCIRYGRLNRSSHSVISVMLIDEMFLAVEHPSESTMPLWPSSFGLQSSKFSFIISTSTSMIPFCLSTGMKWSCTLCIARYFRVTFASSFGFGIISGNSS